MPTLGASLKVKVFAGAWPRSWRAGDCFGHVAEALVDMSH